MNIAFTKKSSNAKVGAIPVTTSSKKTCPNHCALKDKGCYASAGFHTNLHWDKVTSGERGTDIAGLCEKVAQLKEGSLWRHNVAGDLIGSNDKINGKALKTLVKANKGRKGFTYTHYPLTNAKNLDLVRYANSEGFTINASTDTVAEAIETKKLKLPVVTIVDSEFWSESNRVGSIVRCPAETSETITCKSCKLCSVSDRKDIIAFTVHGTKAKQASIIARG